MTPTDEELMREWRQRMEEGQAELSRKVERLAGERADEKLTPRERMSRGFAAAAKAKEADRKRGGDNGD